MTLYVSYRYYVFEIYLQHLLCCNHYLHNGKLVKAINTTQFHKVTHKRIYAIKFKRYFTGNSLMYSFATVPHYYSSLTQLLEETSRISVHVAVFTLACTFLRSRPPAEWRQFNTGWSGSHDWSLRDLRRRQST